MKKVFLVIFILFLGFSLNSCYCLCHSKKTDEKGFATKKELAKAVFKALKNDNLSEIEKMFPDKGFFDNLPNTVRQSVVKDAFIELNKNYIELRNDLKEKKLFQEPVLFKIGESKIYNFDGKRFIVCESISVKNEHTSQRIVDQAVNIKEKWYLLDLY